MKTIFTDEILQYVISHNQPENHVLQQLRAYNDATEFGRLQITQDQGNFLAFLAKLIDAKTYLEIGVFTGYSSLVMALAMGKNSKIYALEHRLDHIEIAKKYWDMADVSNQIEVKLDDAINSLQSMIDDKLHDTVDIAFVDANKNGYMQYYEYCYQLVRPSGLIIIDNVLMRGEVLNHAPKNYVKSIQQFNNFLCTDERVDMCMLTIGDGISIVRKKPL